VRIGHSSQGGSHGRATAGRLPTTSGNASVAGMESADLRDGDDPATWRGFDDSWLGPVVVKRLMWPRGVVVGEIRAQDAAEMGAVQNDDVIQALTPDGADHRFRERVLPGRSGGGEHLADPHGSDASREGLAVDRVSIPQEVWRAGLVRERLNDLANGPGRGGVFGHVDVEEFAAVMPQDDENEEQVGGDRGDNEEVDGDNVSGMRGEKGAPGGRRPRRRPGQVLGDGPLGDRVAEQGQLRPNAPAPPRRILARHASDQVAQLGFESRAADRGGPVLVLVVQPTGLFGERERTV
jgi:hypothetical protein